MGCLNMTDDPNPRAVIGANFPPITVPTDTAAHGDLSTRYPEVKTEIDGFESALKTFPSTIETEDEAKALSDVLGKIKSVLDAYRKKEKGPWDKIVKVVQNFFTTPKEKIEAWDEEYRPRLKAYTDKKEEEARKAAEARAEAERRDAERLHQQAEERAMDALWAEAKAELAAYDERKARERAEAAEQQRREAEERAEAARLEEKRLSDEKKARERAEKDRNAANLCEIRRQMKEAERLNKAAADLDEDVEPNEDDMKTLDSYIRVGGSISALASPVAQSLLLDDDQKVDVAALRTRLDELRKAYNGRLDAKERRRRAKAQKAEEEAAQKHAEELERQRAEAEAATAKAREDRAAAEAAAERARSEKKAAEGEARAAVKDQTEALREQRAAGRDTKDLAVKTERAENRADRLDRKLDTATDADFGRVRGDLGSVASGTGRWEHDVVDEEALRAVCGPLGEHFTSDALSGAAYRWMAAHRDRFAGERYTDPALPGVVFSWRRDVAIRA